MTDRTVCEHFDNPDKCKQCKEKTGNITIPVDVFLSGQTYNGHHQSQLALDGIKDIELINQIAKAFDDHFNLDKNLDVFVCTQVWPDGSWTIYKEVKDKQFMLLSSLDK